MLMKITSTCQVSWFFFLVLVSFFFYLFVCFFVGFFGGEGGWGFFLFGGLFFFSLRVSLQTLLLRFALSAKYHHKKYSLIFCSCKSLRYLCPPPQCPRLPSDSCRALSKIKDGCKYKTQSPPCLWGKLSEVSGRSSCICCLFLGCFILCFCTVKCSFSLVTMERQLFLS